MILCAVYDKKDKKLLKLRPVLLNGTCDMYDSYLSTDLMRCDWFEFNKPTNHSLESMLKVRIESQACMTGLNIRNFISLSYV